jgi:hypothetical protein
MSPTTDFPGHGAFTLSKRPNPRRLATATFARTFAIEPIDNSPPLAFISCCCELEARRLAISFFGGRRGFPSRINEIIAFAVDPSTITPTQLERIVPDATFVGLERSCSCRR